MQTLQFNGATPTGQMGRGGTLQLPGLDPALCPALLWSPAHHQGAATFIQASGTRVRTETTQVLLAVCFNHERVEDDYQN